MIAVDTNLLVRFLVVDDQAQAERVRSLFMALEAKGDRCFVSDAVLLELIWVLESAYQYPRQDVAKALEIIGQLQVLKLQSEGLPSAVCEDIRSTRMDASDALIARAATGRECDRVLTFDKRAARHTPFQLLQ